MAGRGMTGQGISGQGAWSAEQVEAFAPNPAGYTAAVQIAVADAWSATGVDERAVWGLYTASRGEPYDVVVDHVGVAARCSCPSRRLPCKHSLALLLLWVSGQVPPSSSPPERVASWVARRTAREAATAGGNSPGDDGASAGSPGAGGGADTAPLDSPADAPVGDEGAGGAGQGPGGSGADPSGESSEGPDGGSDFDGAPDRDRGRDERVERMYAGLTELDRWLEDRVRTGLADPALVRHETWEDLAARLVDAQAGSLANRIRRLSTAVGASVNWHEEVLGELGVLHLLAQAGRRMGELSPHMADRVATALGWQVRQTEVLAGVPDTDTWVVAGRSDTREDRIEVRRLWLRGQNSGEWALVLSFAAYQQSLDTSLAVGTAVEADLHRYPGRALRALVGRRHGEPMPARPPALSVTEAADEIGRQIAVEPWLDRVPATVRATPTRSDGRWWLTDADAAFPMLDYDELPTLLAVSGGSSIDVTIEWTPQGVVPLAVHRTAADPVDSGPTAVGHSVDVGPVADASFVGGAVRP